MSNRVVLVALVSALCLAGSIAQADVAPPGPTPVPRPNPSPLPVLSPWELKARALLDATNIAPCKKPDGPTGKGEATLAIGPNGSVNSVVVTDVTDGGKYAGTPVGGCVAAKYRGVVFDKYTPRPGQTSVTIHYIFDIK